MSSQKFEDYEEEFHSSYKELEELLKGNLAKLGGEQRKKELRNAEKLVEDVDHLATKLSDEAQLAPGAYRASMMVKVRSYRSQVDKAKRDVAKLAGPAQFGGRDDLLGVPAKPLDDPSAAQRLRFQEGLDSLNQSSASVARSQRVAAETDEIGVQIIGDLDDQRQSLLRTRDKLKQTDADLSRSKRILHSMAIKLATNKILLVCIIVVELCILGAIVYLRFIKK